MSLDPTTRQLVDAIREQDIAAVERLLAEGADANAVVEEPQTGCWDEELHPLLTIAARLGEVSIVRALLAAGARMDAQWEWNEYHFPDGYEGFQAMGDALEVAALHGRAEVVELLLRHGAASRAKALTAAARAGDRRTTKLLLDHGVDPGRSTNAPLCAAVRNDHLEIVRLLVEHGALIDRPQPDDDEHGPPFLASLVLGRPAIARFLLEQGAKMPSRTAFEKLVPAGRWTRENAEATLAALGLTVPQYRKRSLAGAKRRHRRR